METTNLVQLNYTTGINATREIVWEALWQDENYRNWASAFSPGSHARSDWQTGSRILFLGPTGEGMYAVIAKNEKPVLMEFRHQGEWKDGQPQPPGAWTGAREIYRLEETEGGTTLHVLTEVVEEYRDMLDGMWPRALAILKSLAEDLYRQAIRNQLSGLVENHAGETITVETTVNAPVEKVWNCWNSPEHITQWNYASEAWHCPSATNDLRVGGKLASTMAARDGSMSFEFTGVYHNIITHRLIEYTIADGRTVKVAFEPQGNTTRVIETFEMENIHSRELQRGGWQAILDNFKKYTET